MKAPALLAVLALVGCGRAAPANDSAGDRLEAAATAAGLIADPRRSLIGAWARDTDRVCVVPGPGGGTRIGAVVDYGDGQGCAASGTLDRDGDRLSVTFGSCRFAATFDGERLRFPVEVPDPCASLCTGRASLAALAVDRQGDSVSEATTVRAPDGRALCGS